MVKLNERKIRWIIQQKLGERMTGETSPDISGHCIGRGTDG